MAKETRSVYQNVVGLVPAGGQATRIAPLPCSKEVFPIGFRAPNDAHSLRPKVVCQYLLEKMRLAGITKVYIVLRQGKWDIPGYLGDGSILDLHLAYLLLGLPFGVPYTVDQAYPFVQSALTAFGFPDVIFQPDDAFRQLIHRQADTNAQIVLGLFPTDRPDTTDMVEVDNDGWVRSILLRPPHTHLRYAWIIAVWTPAFTCFLHEYLMGLDKANERNGASATGKQELLIGHVLQAALRDGLRIHSVLFPDHNYLDIGTPENLVKAVYDVRFKTGIFL